MNDFIKRLTELRGAVGGVGKKAGNLARGTIKNMSNGRERSQQMLDHERDRNQKMIIENFGSLENYEQHLRENPLPTTPGESLGKLGKKVGKKAKGLGDFFERILNARQR